MIVPSLLALVGGCTELAILGEDVPGPAVAVSIVPNVADAEAPPYMTWNSVWLTRSGRTVEANNWQSSDQPEQNEDNSVRWFDPHTRTHGVYYPTNASTLDWTAYTHRVDLYWLSFDRWLSVNAAIFDLETATFVAGDLLPADRQFWSVVTDSTGGELATESADLYSPALFACPDIDIVGWLGGGRQVDPVDRLVVLRRWPAGSDGMTAFGARLPAGITPMSRARHSAVCIGSTVYVGGGTLLGDVPNTEFSRFDIVLTDVGFEVANTRALAAWPSPESDFPFLGHDPDLDALVLIGRGVYVYDLARDEWSGDLAPSDYATRWPDYSSVMGFFEPNERLFYFRGRYTEDHQVDYGAVYSTLDLVATE